MKPLDIFFIPGEFAVEQIYLFLEYPAREMEPGLYIVFAFLLAIIFWSMALRVTFEIIRKCFGFGRGRY